MKRDSPHYIKHQGVVLNKDIVAVSGLSWGYPQIIVVNWDHKMGPADLAQISLSVSWILISTWR